MNYRKLIDIMVERAEHSYAYKLGRRICKDVNDDMFHYIPTYETTLMRLLDEILPIKNKDKKIFVDAGAGTDMIPDLMAILGFGKSYGIEYRDIYCNLSSSLIQGDILTYDFGGCDVM